MKEEKKLVNISNDLLRCKLQELRNKAIKLEKIGKYLKYFLVENIHIIRTLVKILPESNLPE